MFLNNVYNASNLWTYVHVSPGEDDSNSFARFQMPSTSSPPERTSTAKPESFSTLALLPTSSEGNGRPAADLSANDTLSQSYNGTANGTVAPGEVF